MAATPVTAVPASPAADALALRRRPLTLGLLTTAYFFSYMDRQILAILQELIRKDLNLDDAQLGIIGGLAFALFYATLGIPVARLADRSNRVNIITISLALWSIMTAVCGLAQNFWQLLLARIGVGVGEAGSSPPSHSIIADLYPPERRAGAMGIYSLGVVLGAALGTIIGGTVAHLYGWRIAMFTVGLPGVALAVVIKLAMTEPRRGLSDPEHARAQSGAPMPSLAEGFAGIWRNPAAVHLVMGVTITSMIGYGLTHFGPSFMQRSLGMAMIHVAWIVAPVAGVMGTLSAVLGGMLANRLARTRGLYAQAWMVLVLKMAGLPLALAVYVVSNDPWVVLPVYWLSVLLVNSYLGPTFALIQGLAPVRSRALWAAITLFVINLIGLGLGPTLVGIISKVLRPEYGEESLRYAMFVFAAATPWALYHYWAAGAALKRQATA